MDLLMFLTPVLVSIIDELANHAVTNALQKDRTFECTASRHQQHWGLEALGMWLVGEEGTASAVQIDTKKDGGEGRKGGEQRRPRRNSAPTRR